MFNHDILISPVMSCSDPGRYGEYFLVLRSNGTVSQPNGVHIGEAGMAEDTRASYLKEGVMEAGTIEEFNKMKDWYISVIGLLKYTVIDTINFTQKGLVENIEGSFPEV